MSEFIGLHELEFPADKFFAEVNHAISRSYGLDLFELAESSPSAAYEAIGQGVADVYLSKGIRTTDVQTGISVDGIQDGLPAHRAFTEKLIKDNMVPPIEFKPTDVVISVINRRSLLDIIKQRPPKKSEVLSFRVFPS